MFKLLSGIALAATLFPQLSMAAPKGPELKCSSLAVQAARAIVRVNGNSALLKKMVLKKAQLAADTSRYDTYSIDFVRENENNGHTLNSSFEVVARDRAVSNECLVYSVTTTAFEEP